MSEVGEFRELAERLRAALEAILARVIPASLSRTVFEVFERREPLRPGLYANLRKSKPRDLQKG